MYKTVCYFLIAAFSVLLTACDTGNDFKDIEEAIKLNKLNITSIVVEAGRTKTVEFGGATCGNQNPCNTFLPTGYTEPFKAYGFSPDNKKTDITSAVQWATSDNTIGQISQSGSLTTQSVAANVDVIATLGTVVGKTTITVSTATLSSISFLNGTNDITTTPIVAACDTFPLTVLGLFSDTSKRVITHEITWSAEEASVPTQDAKVVLDNATNQGVFSSHTVPAAPYTVNASYSDNNNNSVQATLDIDVIEPAAGSTMSIDPASLTVATDKTDQFSATITNNSASKDVTSTAKWVTDDVATATVTKGTVTGVKLGTANITASCGSLSKTATVTVANQSEPAFLTLKDDTNLPILSTLELTLNDSTKNTKDLSVIVTNYDQSTADVTADLNIQSDITIVSLDADTSLPVSKSIVASSDLSGTSKLRITALRTGSAMMTVNYSGLVYYQYILVN